MALYDDVTEFATRGVDAAFPARRIARLAALAKSENSLKSARGDDPEVFNKAIQKQKEKTVRARDIWDDWEEAINLKVFPEYAKKKAEIYKKLEENRPTGSWPFNPEGMDKPTSTSQEKSYVRGGLVSSASKRADGIAMRGKTKGKMC
jgi:hypothetical protein